MPKEYPWGKGTPVWVRDAELNDSDKSFTVPAGKSWLLISVEANLTASATVGNRVLECHVTDGMNVVHKFDNSASITATLVGAVCHQCGITPNATVRRTLGTNADAAVTANDSIPLGMVLPAGYVVRVFDSAAIDAAADDLTVVLHYVEYDA